MLPCGINASLWQQKKQDARYIVINSPERARELMDHERKQPGVVKEGFCELTPKQPTKVGGYVQVSAWGGNKFACLQQVSVWAMGEDAGDGLTRQCSHRCGEPRCLTVGHVCVESTEDNNRRKGCLVAVRCHHCEKYYFVCPHQPSCIKFFPGFKSWEDFLENGVHEK